MTALHSEPINYALNPDKEYFCKVKNPSIGKSKFIKGLFVTSLIILTSACNSESSDQITSTTEAASYQTKKTLDPQNIEDSIINSHAILAAKRPDVCPKLLQQQVDNHTIERMAEVMTDKHCDYFLYPRIGERIAVNVNNSQLEALLIVPTIHNFANGDYKVEAYDKHVIRLSYTGNSYKPERIKYDIKIQVIK